MKKTHEIRFKVSQSEHEAIKKKCDEAGIPIAVYIRHVALKSTIRVVLEEF